MGAASVLIVDDNPAAATLLGGVLRDAGYDVRVATAGDRAIQVAVRQPPDLVLLDLRMPGLDGFEVCRRLKADERTAATPVIVISALDEVDEKVRAFAAGASDDVTKPFEPREVLARVSAHVQLLRLRRQLEESRRQLGDHNRELERKNEELEKAERRTQHVFSALADALPGTVLDGKYRLEEKIGRGGFATVFRAEHLALRRDVAVKVFRPWEGNDTPAALERFRREGVSACRVQHPNAVTVMDGGISASGIAYLVMELLEGTTVGDLLRAQKRLPLARTASILVPVCQALAAAHAKALVHRDVKPDNVFLHRTPAGEVVKVLDFGIARIVEESEANQPTMITKGLVGTPAFLAPERVMSMPYDGRADVFSVGVMLFLMLGGEVPFPVRGEDSLFAALMRQATDPVPPLPVEGLPPDVIHIVERTLAREPRERPTAAALAESLRPFAG